MESINTFVWNYISEGRNQYDGAKEVPLFSNSSSAVVRSGEDNLTTLE